jgi:cysteine/O-acetylserine efflux protein
MVPCTANWRLTLAKLDLTFRVAPANNWAMVHAPDRVQPISMSGDADGNSTQTPAPDRNELHSFLPAGGRRPGAAMNADLPAALTFVFVTTLTPGPNNILSASMGALYGYRRTVPFLLGITSGFLVIMLVCTTISSALSRFLQAAAPLLRFLGAVYILWLAFCVCRSSSRLFERNRDTEPLRYWNGLTLQLVNVKASFFGVTVYSIFLIPLFFESPLFMWSPLLLSLVAFITTSAWALGGHAIQQWLKTPRRAHAFGITLAGALVYTALSLVGLFTW